MTGFLVELMFLFVLVLFAVIGGYHVLDTMANLMTYQKKPIDTYRKH